ncbi:sulfotransferase 1B1-like [Haliotis rufescens]|uniref:sulfotransferase 1B1-like n=1 Tax=Haliotis rufescens TaxID=6454 RepID=UPI00201F7C2A|nr:sulfotransferase 1B1-like [Haliotis rufescens]
MATPKHILTLDGDLHNTSENDIKTETDKFGKTIKFMMFRGLHYIPGYDTAVLEEVDNFSMRPDDIYFPSFPRTGTHWTFEIVCMLLKGKAETIQRFKGRNQLEFATNDVLSTLPSPRVINTHFRLSDAPREMKEKKCKIIYNLRDPRDVAVSLYHLYVDLKFSECECSFEGFWYLFLEGKSKWLIYEETQKLDGDLHNTSENDIKTETDKFGKTIKFMMFRGLHYIPGYDTAVLEEVDNFSMRPDDIYFPSFPRTGTHWTFEIVCMLLKGKAETIQRFKGRNQLEFATNDVLSTLPSPRVINTHFRLSDAPREMKEKKCKIIYNLRDPRDVAVSLYHLYVDLKFSECECSFEGFWYLFLEGKTEVDGIF